MVSLSTALRVFLQRRTDLKQARRHTESPARQFEFPNFHDSGWQFNPVKQLRDAMPVRAAPIAEGILALGLTLGLQDVQRVFSRGSRASGKAR